MERAERFLAELRVFLEYFLRFLLCVLRWALIVVVVLALSVGVFLFAMDYANVTILATDGMTMRAGVVLGYNDASELTKFFTEDYLAGDELLKDTTYLDYTINSFDAQVDVESLHTLPWENTATVVVTESVTIDGELPISKQTPEQLADPNKIPPPPWEGGTYELTLQKDAEHRWIITDVVKTASEEPAPSGEAADVG